MSAITGIFYRNGKEVDPELIKKMNDRLSHRGHDGSAVYCDGPVAFGHQMLWTTPESVHEKLPFENENSSLVITADARIDNRNELSEELDIEDKEDVSDSYFILKAYEKWGEKCPEYLLGDFAFAIWDKNNEKLFCARDHMGVKPFYYYLDDNKFVFGTEIKSLFCVPEVPYKLDKLKLAFYLTRSVTDKNLTFYEDIFFLENAHSYSINQDVFKMRKYWEIDPESKIIMTSEEEYIQSFIDIFTESVSCRLRSAFPIGFELSGGLDSSSVVCLAKKILNEKNDSNACIDTYSMVYNEFPQTDERYYIKKVVDSGGINPHYVINDKVSPLENIEEILWYQDQPILSNTVLRNMYKNMHDGNIRILLGGLGGDQIVFRGINYFTDLAFNMHWKLLIKEIKAFSKLNNTSFWNGFLKLIIIPLTPEFIKIILRNIINFYKKSEKNEYFILNKDFAKKWGGEDYFKKFSFNFIKSKLKTARKFHYFVVNFHNSVLEVRDRDMGSFFMESRYPYYDKRLVEFCYAIPDDMKFKFGFNRYILRSSMENILPKEVQWRSSKKYFDSVLEKNLLLYEKNILNEIFLNENSLIKNYVNIEILKTKYEKYCFGNKNINVLDLYFVTIVYLWLQYSNIIENDVY